MKRFVLGALLMLCCTYWAIAQVDSLYLDSVVITLRGDQKLQRIEQLDQMRARNVGDVLNQRSSVFVKANSGNSLSTLSIRGGTSEQSAVYWNGLSLQNTLNGSLDLSLLPTEAFSSMELNSTNSTSIGSGAINGSLHLTNDAKLDSTWLTLHAGIGSFGQLNGHMRLNKTILKGNHQLLIYQRQAENNYPYIQPSWNGVIIRRLNHARFSSFGAMYMLKQSIKNNNPLHVRLWIQGADREIPNSTVEGPSRKYQQDGSIRLQADWSKMLGKTTVKLNAGSFYEALGYQDSASKIYSNYAFFNQSLLLHAKRKINRRLQLGFDVETRSFTGDADTFYQVSRLEFAQALHGQYQYKRSKLQASLRSVQYINHSDKPLLFAVQFRQKFTSSLSLVAKYASNYRMPTFNSLYWNPGGNPNLLSERSTNLDISALYQNKRLRARFTLYDYVITNQITWLPGNSGYFEAVQVADQQQWNRGAEFAVNYAYKRWSSYYNLSILKSTVRHDSLRPWEGQQQIYVPHLQGNAGIRYNCKWFKIGYQTWSMSSRELGTPQGIVDLSSGPIVVHGIHVDLMYRSLLLNIQVNNLGNRHYALLPYRPNMPRNLSFSITHQLYKKENK